MTPSASQTLQGFWNSLRTMFRRHGSLNLLCASFGVGNQSEFPFGTKFASKKNRAQLCTNYAKEFSYLCISASVSLRSIVVVVRQCPCQTISLMVTNLKNKCIFHIFERKITCPNAVACSNKYKSSGLRCSLPCLDAQIVCFVDVKWCTW